MDSEGDMTKIEVGDRTFRVVRTLCKNKNASARLRNDTIFISIPIRWPNSEKRRVYENLFKRAVRAIERGRWGIRSNKKLEFDHGQKLSALGTEFELEFIPSKRFMSKLVDGKIIVKFNEQHEKRRERIAVHVRKHIVDGVMPNLLAKINAINSEHFRSKIKRIRIRDNLTRWGSCSKAGGISLSFRLLFMPERILDYVIVHELAHTHYRSHGKRFWATVERVIPDHKVRRKWLRENGWSYPEQKADVERKADGQTAITEFISPQ